MIKLIRYLAFLLIAILFIACPAFGAGWPAPGPSPNTLVSILTVSAPTAAISLPNSPYSLMQKFIMNVPATITIPTGNFSGQAVAVEICQNATGGNPPTLVAPGLTFDGLGLAGLAPFVTGPNQCGDFGLIYMTPTSVYISGSNPGPI